MSRVFSGGKRNREAGRDLKKREKEERLRRNREMRARGLDPDLTFVLDIDPALSARRLAGRSKANDRIDDESAGFFERARAGFLELAAREPRMRVLDGSLAPEALLEEAMRCISTS